MSGKTAEQPHADRSTWTPQALYFATIAAYLAASFFPAERVWGFSLFAYFPTWGWATGLGLAVMAGIASEVLGRRYPAGDAGEGRGYAVVAPIISLLMPAGFYLLRAKTFFLGDGYTLLSDLTSHSPMIHKARELFESAAHARLFDALGGTTRPDAILTYQIISIAAGVLFLFTVAFCARAIFRQNAERLLFFLGLISGGWMLLYFGYAENYSMFVLLVAVYCLIGLLVMQGRPGRWTIGLLQIVLLGLHVLGATLIPATLYLLLHDTKPAVWFGRLSRMTRRLLMGGGVIGVAAILVVVAQKNLFFRITFVPLTNSLLVPEHYTLFSFAHLADYVNLLFLLVPGLLLLLYGFARLPLRTMFGEPIFRWQILAALGPLGAAFIFDPKLGMPRDWDLFSFAGVPLAGLLLYGLLARCEQVRSSGRIVLLAVLVGFVALGARAVWLATPALGVAHYRDDLNLDKVKNRNGWTSLVSYYLQAGDTTTALQTRAEWKRNFPEEDLIGAATRLLEQSHDTSGAEALVRHILEINPAYPDAYTFLGRLYLLKGEYDRALAELARADALSPNRSINLNNMGQAYFGKGEYEKAEALLLKAAAVDSVNFSTQYNLARFYRARNNAAGYVKYLARAAIFPETTPAIVEEYILVLLRQGKVGQARRIYCASPAVRADSSFFPAAAPHLPGIDTLLICR